MQICSTIIYNILQQNYLWYSVIMQHSYLHCKLKLVWNIPISKFELIVSKNYKLQKYKVLLKNIIFIFFFSELWISLFFIYLHNIKSFECKLVGLEPKSSW